MLNAILTRLGLRKRPGEGPTGVPKYTKRNVRPAQYYRRGGSYYSDDGSLIEDLLLIAILDEYYAEGAITESYPEPEVGNVDTVDTTDERIEPEVDILDIEVDDIPVIESQSIPDPTPVPEPEPVRTSYSSGYSGGNDYDGGSSYDSGGDSGGGSDD
jgi:hypothetical protein